MPSSSSWWSSSSPSLNQNRSLGACRIGPKGGVLPATVWRKAKRCHGDRAAKENLFFIVTKATERRGTFAGGGGGRQVDHTKKSEMMMRRDKGEEKSEVQRCEFCCGRRPSQAWAGPASATWENLFHRSPSCSFFFFSFLFFIWVSELRLQNTYCERFDNFWTALPLGLH